MTEQDLIESLTHKEESGYKYAIEQYGDLVFNTALGFVQNEPDAQDISQEVFVEIFQSISKFKGQSSFKTWIYRITVTKSLDLLKKNKSIKRGGYMKRVFGGKDGDSMPDIPHFEHPGVTAENKETASILFMEISKLPEKQRIAFTLNKVEQLSYKEIAKIMKLSLSSVESLIFRAKANLKKQLESFYQRNEL